MTLFKPENTQSHQRQIFYLNSLIEILIHIQDNPSRISASNQMNGLIDIMQFEFVGNQSLHLHLTRLYQTQIIRDVHMGRGASPMGPFQHFLEVKR